MGKVVFYPAPGGNGAKSFGICLFGRDIPISLVNGETIFTVPAEMDGMNLTAVIASLGNDKGIGGVTEVRITKRREGSNSYMFTTNISIGDVWFADNCVIDPAYSQVLKGDTIRADVVTVHTTPPKGLTISGTFS